MTWKKSLFINWSVAAAVQLLSVAAPPLNRNQWSHHFLCLSWKLTTFSLCMAAHQAQQTAQSAKNIKMLRINEARWSIVYFKYLIFIFLWSLQTDWPMLAERSVCWLVFPMHWILVCLFVSLMETTCRNVLVKSCIKILWQKQYIFHDTFEFLCWTTWRHLYFTKW